MILNFKLQNMKDKLVCTVCETNDKQKALPCGHMFCEDCIELNLRSRQRNCPMCRAKFTQQEGIKLHWGGDQNE